MKTLILALVLVACATEPQPVMDVDWSVWLDSGTGGQPYCLITSATTGAADAIGTSAGCQAPHHCGEVCAAELGQPDGIPVPSWFVACDPEAMTLTDVVCGSDG